MTRLAIILTALGLCLVARADTGAGDLAPEARTLVADWLAAQNRGDFATYEKLYARKLTGVRRSGPRTVQLDRAGWMRDRQRMFQKPMKVAAEDVRIAATPASARVTFTQDWQSGSYHDRGPKQLVIVREDGAPRIAREEMLASEPASAAGAGAGTTAERLAFLVGKYAIVDEHVEPAWATGAARLDDDGDPVITSKRATGLPPALARWVGRKLAVYTAGDPTCTATVRELRVVSLVVPHFGTRQDWRDQKKSPREQATEAWDLGGTPMLGALLDGSCDLQQAAFARAAELPAPKLIVPVDDDSVRAAALQALRALPSWRALQKTWAGQGGKGRWDEKAPGAEISVQRWDLPTPIITINAQASEGCDGFSADLFAVFERSADGKLTFRGEPSPLHPTVGLMLDGVPTLVGRTADFGVARHLWPVGGAVRKLEVPYLDCPC
jgi:ketosteroid isomerase-like protein